MPETPPDPASDADQSPAKEGEFDWFDRPKSRSLLWKILWGVCLLFLALEFTSGRKAYFGIEKIPGFFALLGFVACAVSILVAKGLGYLLKVREDYYEPEESDLPWDVEGGEDDA